MPERDLLMLHDFYSMAVHSYVVVMKKANMAAEDIIVPNKLA